MELFQNEAVRVVIISIVASIAAQIVKNSFIKNYLCKCTWLMRLIAVCIVALFALAADWQVDGIITANSWLTLFVPSIPTTDITYQWIIKSLEERANRNAEKPTQP